MDHKSYLKLAIAEASEGMRAGEGGPFGAIIVRNGKILGRGHNTVLKTHDPTAHAEVNAIRNACNHVKEHHLTGATLYTNFEPCPMCLGAIYWADIRIVYYGAGRQEAQKIGFMDNHLYQEFSRPPEEREMTLSMISVPEMGQCLEEWNNMDGKILY